MPSLGDGYEFPETQAKRRKFLVFSLFSSLKSHPLQPFLPVMSARLAFGYSRSPPFLSATTMPTKRRQGVEKKANSDKHARLPMLICEACYLFRQQPTNQPVKEKQTESRLPQQQSTSGRCTFALVPSCRLPRVAGQNSKPHTDRCKQRFDRAPQTNLLQRQQDHQIRPLGRRTEDARKTHRSTFSTHHQLPSQLETTHRKITKQTRRTCNTSPPAATTRSRLELATSS